MAPGCLHLDPAAHKIQQGPSRPTMVRRGLRFPTWDEPLYREDEAIDLPSTLNYTPVGIDHEFANALTAL